jgi:hypothetical protein
MKKAFLLQAGILLSYCILFSTYAQTTDSASVLEYETGFWSPTYKHNGLEIDSDEFESILNSANDSEINGLYRSSKTFNTLANVAGFAGGFCLGYGAFSKESQTAFLAAGAGISVVGIVLQILGHNNLTDAVSKYNEIHKQNEVLSLENGNVIEFQLGISLVLR